MSLCIFDLDNTLLAGDSDYLWGQFLVEQGIVDGPEYERLNQEFYARYQAGTLDIFEFLRFSLKPLSEHPVADLYAWRNQFLETCIRPIILPKAQELIRSHQQRGHTTLIITATNDFVTGPIAEALGIPHLLATQAEFVAGRYTGEVRGIPCFREGKVRRLHTWLAQQGIDLKESWFYSDSHNDMPLLSEVSHPVATDPDAILRQLATERGWPVISLRDACPTPAHC